MPQVTNAEIKELITEQAGIVNSNFKKAKAAINTKVDKVEGKGLSTEDFTTALKGKLDALPTNAELQAGYVAKEAGKGLSTNDFTDALQTKLNGIETGAQVNVLEGVQLNGTDITIDANKKANIVLPAAAEYTMVKQDTAEEGYASTYYLTKDGVQVGAKINLAKDQVLQNVELKQCTVADQPIEGLEVGDYYFDFTFQNKSEHIYLAAKALTDVYTAGAGLTLTNGEFAVNTADTSVVDTAPTASSTKLVQSGGVYSAIDTVNTALGNHTSNADIHVTAADKTAWSGKQDTIADLATIRSNAEAGKAASDALEAGDYQETIDANNKLSADLVDDTSTTHKFVTAAEKAKIAEVDNKVEEQDVLDIIDDIFGDISITPWDNIVTASKLYCFGGSDGYAFALTSHPAVGDPIYIPMKNGEYSIDYNSEEGETFVDLIDLSAEPYDTVQSARDGGDGEYYSYFITLSKPVNKYAAGMELGDYPNGDIDL